MPTRQHEWNEEIEGRIDLRRVPARLRDDAVSEAKTAFYQFRKDGPGASLEDAVKAANRAVDRFRKSETRHGAKQTQVDLDNAANVEPSETQRRVKALGEGLELGSIESYVEQILKVFATFARRYKCRRLPNTARLAAERIDRAFVEYLWVCHIAQEKIRHTELQNEARELRNDYNRKRARARTQAEREAVDAWYEQRRGEVRFEQYLPPCWQGNKVTRWRPAAKIEDGPRPWYSAVKASRAELIRTVRAWARDVFKRAEIDPPQSTADWYLLRGLWRQIYRQFSPTPDTVLDGPDREKPDTSYSKRLSRAVQDFESWKAAAEEAVQRAELSSSSRRSCETLPW